MAENYVDRARVIMARVKNNSSPLDGKIGATEAIRYADAFVETYAKHLFNVIDPETGEVTGTRTIGEIPNEDKAKAYVNHLRSHHRDVYKATKGPSAGEAAKAAALATAETTVDTDLGTEE